MTIQQKLSRTRASIPFKPEARMSASAVVNPDDSEKITVYVKGAPETIFEMCNRQLEFSDAGEFDRENATNYVKTAAATPLRMIAFATAEMNVEDWESRYENGDGCPEKLLEDAMRGNEIEFTLVGVFGLYDSIRSMVPSCVRHVREGAKMMVRMVSGDHVETARKVAKKSGILEGKEAIHDYAVMTGE